MIRTLGIDLASQDKDTAVCSVEWVSGAVIVNVPIVRVGDDAVIEHMASADWIGIDAPFGWPDDFVQAVHAYAVCNEWPAHASGARMRYRETDAFVHHTLAAVGERLSPLSVSSERIAACAWRCARLLSRFAAEHGWTFDRVGVPFANGIDGPPRERRASGLAADRSVTEVYPAAALAIWDLPFNRYKTRTKASAEGARAARTVIFDTICSRMDLIVPDPARSAMLDSDHALDAFICALVAYAAAIGETYPPGINQLGAARREGWIHVPYPDSLFNLS